MQAFLVVFLGAGLGGVLRHGVNIACARACGTAFPFGTLVVNVAGSLAIGLLAGWLAVRADAAWSQSTRLFLVTGLLGGFTTFSAFSLDAIALAERNELAAAALYVGASVFLSILACAAGLAVARALT